MPPGGQGPGEPSLGITSFTAAETGREVTFSWQIANPAGLSVSCRIDFGDSSAVRDMPGCTPATTTHTYPDTAASYTAQLRVNAVGADPVSRTVQVTIVRGQPPVEPPVVDPPAGFSAEMLAEVNYYRSGVRTCGSVNMHPVAPLSWDSRLEAAAQGHSNYMAETGTFSHTGRNDSNPPQRVTAAGYNWRAVAENIAVGPTTVKQVVAGWMASPGHCANIMSANFQDLGAAMAVSSNGYRYWTQNFGRQ